MLLYNSQIESIMKYKLFRRLNPYRSIIIAVLLQPLTSMAIVNMDSMHFSDDAERFDADVDLTVSGASGNSNNFRVALNSQFSWVKDKSINLAILGHQYGENNDLRNINKTFLHYRNINKLMKNLDWEVFTQLEENEFTRLSFRGLAGAGLRFSLSKSEIYRAYFGAGGFYSVEETAFTQGLTDHGKEEVARANLYYFSKYKVSQNVAFSNALYYQPDVSDFADFRALFNSKLDLAINKNISFRLSLEVEHDSGPSQTVERTDIQYKTGIKYHF